MSPLLQEKIYFHKACPRPHIHRLSSPTSFCRLLYNLLLLSVRRPGLGEGGRVLPAEEGLAAARHPCPRPAAGQAQHLLHLALTTHQGSSLPDCGPLAEYSAQNSKVVS
jgi:hypothetical protein